MRAPTELLAALVALLWTFSPVSSGERCSSFRHLENGRTFFRYGGLYVTFSCNSGYKMHGYRTNSCVSDRWSREPPVCVASGCRRPGNLQHGASSVLEDGSWVLFSCDSGYRLRGHSLLYCKGQSWNGTKPVCKESDIMSSREQRVDPAVSMSRVQNPNQDPHALKTLQIHYDTIVNPAFKEVFLKPVHNHLKDPHVLVLKPKILDLEGILTDTTVFTGREEALQKPFKVETSISIAASETLTSRSITTTETLTSRSVDSTETVNSRSVASTETVNSRSVASTETVTSRSVTSTETLTSTSLAATETLTSPSFGPTETLTSTSFGPTETLTSTSLAPTETLTSTSFTSTETLTSTSFATTETLTSPSLGPTETLTSTSFATTETLTSTSLAATETLTSPSVLAVSSDGTYGHQGTSVAQLELEDSLPRKGERTEATHLQPGLGITEPADVSSRRRETVSQPPHSQITTDSNSQASMDLLSSTVSLSEVSPFRVSPVPTQGWRSVLTDLLHTLGESAFLSPSVSQRNRLFNAGSSNNTNTSYIGVNSTIQENGNDPSERSGDQANKTQWSRSPVGDLTSPERARNRSAYHLLKGATLVPNDTDTENDLDNHSSKTKETKPVSVGDADETAPHTVASPDSPPPFKSERRLVTGHPKRSGPVSRRPVCPYPPLPAHGTFYFRTVEKPGLQDYKHYIQYACYAGYTLAHGDPHSYCLLGGRWSGVTPVCLDVDECVEGPRHCQQTCVNTFGSFRCSCLYGQTLAGDGRTCVTQCPAGYRKHPSTPVPGKSIRGRCVDINECERTGEGTPVNRCEWKCVNLPGSHRCICPKGYHLDTDGHRCQDINECSRGNGGCSHVCLNHKGSYRCACPPSHRISPYSKKKCRPRKELDATL